MSKLQHQFHTEASYLPFISPPLADDGRKCFIDNWDKVKLNTV